MPQHGDTRTLLNPIATQVAFADSVRVKRVGQRLSQTPSALTLVAVGCSLLSDLRTRSGKTIGLMADLAEQHQDDEWRAFAPFMSGQTPSEVSTAPTDRVAKTPRFERSKGFGSGGKRSMPPPTMPTLSEQADDQDSHDTLALCKSMAHLLLRQEDAIKTLQLDTSFVMWLRLSLPGGAPEGMAVIQKRWREQQRLGQVSAPLRHVLWMNLWEELKRRLCPDAMTEEQQAEFIKMDFLSKSGEGSLSWPYLRWSAENKKLVPDSTRPPLTILEAHQTVTQLLQLSDPSQITRFHPTRPITSEMRGQTLTLLISVSNRDHNAQLLHGALIKLSNNACTQVLGMTYRPERLKRSPLATHIASMLEEMDPASRS